MSDNNKQKHIEKMKSYGLIKEADNESMVKYGVSEEEINMEKTAGRVGITKKKDDVVMPDDNYTVSTSVPNLHVPWDKNNKK